MTDWKIKNLYEMLYPYGHYNGDAAFACIAINRELKTICDDKFRLALLIIGRSMGYTFKPDTPTKYICQTIQNELLDVCLGEGLSDEDKAKVITGLKLGVTRPMSDLEIQCKKYRNRYYNPFMALYNIRPGNIMGLLYEYLRTLGDEDEYENEEEEMEDWGARINLFEGWQGILKLLKEGKHAEVFKMALDESGGMISLVDRKRLGGQLNKSEVDFLNYIVKGILEGRLDITTLTWDDVCK